MSPATLLYLGHRVHVAQTRCADFPAMYPHSHATRPRIRLARQLSRAFAKSRSTRPNFPHHRNRDPVHRSIRAAIASRATTVESSPRPCVSGYQLAMSARSHHLYRYLRHRSLPTTCPGQGPRRLLYPVPVRRHSETARRRGDRATRLDLASLLPNARVTCFNLAGHVHES